MNILFVVPYAPNLIRVRPYNFIRYLAKFGNQVTVATLWSNEEDLEDIERLRGEGIQVKAEKLPIWRPIANSLKTLPSKQPLQAHYSWQPNLANKLNELCANGNGRFPFDAIHIEHIRGAKYGLYLKKLVAEKYNGPQVPLVWDSVDCISLLFRKASSHSKSLKGRLMTQLDLKRTEEYEAWLVKQFDQVLLTSPFDRDAFLDLLSPTEIEDYYSKIHVLPNGVDLDYFRPDNSVKRDSDTLVVSGKMSYHANITMVVNLVQEIMPLVWEKRPDIKLQIVGKDPARNIQAMAEHPQIEVMGTVPDLRPFLQQATVAVAPIVYGVGIQNKVLEAMACATPVVATSQAVSALTAVPGRDILVGSEPSQLTDAILQLVNDPVLSREIGENGHSFVTKEHNWTTITKRLETYYQMQRFKI